MAQLSPSLFGLFVAKKKVYLWHLEATIVIVVIVVFDIVVDIVVVNVIVVFLVVRTRTQPLLNLT